MVKTFDPKCLELARHFLRNLPEDDKLATYEEELARVIQSAIEDYLEFVKAK